MLEFLTPPKQHRSEIRCYIRDPDGHLIEVGQTTNPRVTGHRSLAIEYAAGSPGECRITGELHVDGGHPPDTETTHW